MMAGGARLILTTLPTREAARAMAQRLVEERLAACVQLAAVESCYRWDGAIERAEEVRLEIKTSPARAEEAMARVVELHGYAVPEIVMVVASASADYLAWIDAETVATD